MGWGEQAQIAVDRELNPPKGPGGNPKVDRRSTTGSNFMRCLPDQATSLTQLTSDRMPFLGGSAAVVQSQCQRRRRSKLSMQLCRAERDQPGGWAEIGGADGSDGAAGGSGGPYQDSMLMSHGDGSESGAHGGSWGSHVGSQACGAGQMTNSSQSQSIDCISSFSGQTSSFFFHNRHNGQRTPGHCHCAVKSSMNTEAHSRLCYASKQSMLSSNSCSLSCGCSHHSSSGRSHIGMCSRQRHARHDCVSGLQHDRMGALHASSVQQQVQSWTSLCAAPVRSHVGHSVATVPSGLVQNRLHSRTVLSSLSTARCRHRVVQGFARSYAQQRQVASRLCL